MPPDNPFIRLTTEFNHGRLRAIICSGQAVVLHRLAMMSKDGDWILREDESDLAHIRAVLGEHGARYRYGAPLDVRWLAGGWSSHLEFRTADGLRVRTDFFSRPPRLNADQVSSLWREQEGAIVPFVGLRDLALMKMTQREKDYPIIGELARRLPGVQDQFRFSRSAVDLIRLASENSRQAKIEATNRPLLAMAIAGDRERLIVALDAERRRLMEVDAVRLAKYQEAAAAWMKAWPEAEERVADLPLVAAHDIICGAAINCLPFAP